MPPDGSDEARDRVQVCFEGDDRGGHVGNEQGEIEAGKGNHDGW